MRERVFGIETEYAVIYHPGRGETERPTNLELYGLLEPRLQERVHSLPRAASLLRSKRGRFLENGASFHYEATPQHFEHGLVELASAECRDPFALLVHERAKDDLVEELAAAATHDLRRLHYSGEVRIGKNNVDSRGHTFGSHESYWVEDPLPTRRKLLLLPLWLGAWAVAIPAFAWLFVALLGVFLMAFGSLLLPVAALPLAGAASLAARWPGAARTLRRQAAALRGAPPRLFRWVEANPGELARRLSWLEAPLHPVIALHSALHRRFHFQALHRALTAHLVTRTLYTGAGAVAFDGGPLLRLAQRPPFLRRMTRIFTSGEDRPVYESRDVFFRPWSAFASRRRLHLMIGDANLCEWAQLLRTGTTALVLEAIEAEPEGDWPELEDPLGALADLNRDEALKATFALRGAREPATALAIQRAYLDGVRSVLARSPEPPEGWKVRVLHMWRETLELLASDPDALTDRIDWLAKRALLRRDIADPEDVDVLRRRGAALLSAGPPEDDEGQRLRELAFRALRTDLRYHELGPRGGYRRLRGRDRVRRIADDDDVARARHEPPADTRAHARGAAIREASGRPGAGGATWHRVRQGPFTWRFFLDPLDPG